MDHELGSATKEAKKELEVIERAAEKEGEALFRIAKYEEGRIAKYFYSLIKFLLSPIIRKLWVAEVEGLHNIPKDGAFLLAANHESYFDFLCSVAVSPRKIHYLAAEKFFESKLWRPLMKLTGQIRVDRKSKDKNEVLDQVFSALEQGRVIGIFPEGTRSRDGNFTKAFTGVAKIALRARVPVVPVGIVGTFEIMSPHDKFPKLRKAILRFGEPMHFKELYDIDHNETHYRLVTDKIMHRIAALTGRHYPHAEKIETEILFEKP